MSGVLRVLTTNLYNGRASPRSLERLLEDVAPDVVAAQELAPDVAAVIAARYDHHLIDARLDFLGGCLATRYPATIEPLPMEHRAGMRAMLDPTHWPGLTRPLEVITVHIANPLLRPVRHHAWIRGRQAAALLDHVARADFPRVVVGDFNATPLWPVYRGVARVLVDAAAATGSARRTWGPRWWTPRLLRIDHAFVQGLEPVATGTRRIRGADHSALIVDVALP